MHRTSGATNGTLGIRSTSRCGSSAVWFAGFKERTQPISIPPEYEPPRVATPQTWLLLEGYKRAKPISVFEVPGPRV